jgi:hypothetical protein
MQVIQYQYNTSDKPRKQQQIMKNLYVHVLRIGPIDAYGITE